MDGFEKRFLWEWAVFSRSCLVLYNAKMAEDFHFSVREGGFKRREGHGRYFLVFGMVGPTLNERPCSAPCDHRLKL